MLISSQIPAIIALSQVSIEKSHFETQNLDGSEIILNGNILAAEVYLEPCQISKVESFPNLVEWLQAVNYFYKKLHLRCLIGF